MKLRVALALAPLALAVACGGGESIAPKGWRPMPGAGAAWTSGSGPSAQEYRYRKTPFAGSLHDLASQVTIDVLTGNRGARLISSNPFEACPGAAGLQSFALAPTGKRLQEGFAVRDNAAIRVTYLRPAGAPVAPEVVAAMQGVLCRLSP